MNLVVLRNPERSWNLSTFSFKRLFLWCSSFKLLVSNLKLVVIWSRTFSKRCKNSRQKWRRAIKKWKYLRWSLTSNNIKRHQNTCSETTSDHSTTSKNGKSTKNSTIDHVNDQISRNRPLKAMRFCFSINFGAKHSLLSWPSQLTEGGTQTPQRKTQNFTSSLRKPRRPWKLSTFSLKVLFLYVMASRSWSQI